MIRDLYKVNQYSDYENHIHDEFTDPNINPINDILVRSEHKYHFRSEETGLFHPFSKANIKLENDETLNMFSENEVGMRLDPHNQSLHEFGNGKKSTFFSMIEWLTADQESYVGGNKKTKVYGTTDFWGKKKITIEGKDEYHMMIDKDIRIEGHNNLDVTIDKNNKVLIKGNSDVKIMGNSNVEIIGNVNAKVNGHAKIDVNRNLDIHSDSNINMTASNVINIDARRINIG